MPYNAEISRANPSCFLFLVDQSRSMNEKSAGEDAVNTKAEDVALAINNLLRNLVILCSKAEGVRDYFHIGVVGYGEKVGDALVGPLAGRGLVPISEIGNNPARLEERTRKVPDGTGGLVEQKVRVPIWVDPVANAGTPMMQAMKYARALLEDWVADHPDCFPPTVIHITDGESTDGDPSYDMRFLTDLTSSDGNVLLFNVHMSSNANVQRSVFPTDPDTLPDDYAKMLFHGASYLTPHLRNVAKEFKHNPTDGSKMFMLNADPVLVIEALSIGTRPSNLGK